MDNTSGASNANDFQPPTRNPQSAAQGLQNTQQGLQSVTGGSQAQLNTTQSLTVETAQSGTTGDLSVGADSGQSNAGISTLLFIVIILVAGFLYKRWNLFAPSTQTNQESATKNDTVPEKPIAEKATNETVVDSKEPVPKPKTKSKPKKSKSKAKKKSKR